MELILILFPGIIAIITSALMSKKWKKHEKVDKGIELCYWKLSYRRKLIRTLWMIPIAIFIVLCFYITFWSTIWTFLVAVAFAMILLIQAMYNYKKWKKEEQNHTGCGESLVWFCFFVSRKQKSS